ncbi:hypothetical protein [Streptomyces sp. C]|uniref:hypothetical protein n=1 Tax=Streptomyces sp. C TaxID=253839 RepID=UPI0001B536BF|nr:hypothetical protein [Streptomyces sp. C]EFL15310.1 predicted protein [Streptomyces sp. C]
MPLTGILTTDGVEPHSKFTTKCLFVRDKEDVPHEDSLADLYALGEDQIGRWVLAASKISLPTGMSLVGDRANWDQALIVQPDTSPADMRKGLAVLQLLGLEPLDEDESEPEWLEDGSVRLWLVPITPEDPFAADEDMESRA